MRTPAPRWLKRAIVMEFIDSLESAGMSTGTGSFTTALRYAAEMYVRHGSPAPDWGRPLMPTEGVISEW